MGQPGSAERSIKAQLNRIVLIPSVTFLVLFAVLSTATLVQAVSLRGATGDGRSGLHLYHSIVELQKERRLAVEYLRSPSEEALQTLREQGAVADNAVREIGEHDDGLRGLGAAEEAEPAADFLAETGRRGDVRAAIMAGEVSAGEAMTEYTAIVDQGIRLYDAMVRRLDDSQATAIGFDVVGLMRAQNLFTQSDALLSGAIAEGKITAEEQIRFAALVADLRHRLQTTGPQLRGEAADAYTDLVDGKAWKGMNEWADAVVEQGDSAEAAARQPPEGIGGWRADADEVDADLTALIGAQAEAVITATDNASSWMFTLALGGGIMTMFAGTLAYGIASKSAARLTARLARLRADTLSQAREELPRIVRLLANGDAIDPGTALKRLDHGGDEIGQVADAFNIAQRTAVSAAVKQADLRAGANRVFLAIAHRNQSLVQRQLQMLDRIEREEEDPDLIEDLFHIDHLATRGRRNAENLIILGGGQPGRRWRSPIPLVDILRGAVSETEEYTRVKLRGVPELALSGAVIADVIHLMAELVENATAFSPPHTMVYIHSETVPKGVVVEVEDRGLGMSEEAFAEANGTLAEAPEFDVMALNQDFRLGLFVVARLADKHGIRVELRPSPYGGTRAIVLIPAALISSGDTAVRVPAEETGPLRRGEGDLPATESVTGNVPHGDDEDQQSRESDSGALPIRRGRPKESPKSAGTEVPGVQSGGSDPAGATGEHENGGPERPALPRRRRQSSLAPQLRTKARSADRAGTGPEARRSPENARQMISAFQAGTRRGRAGDPDAVGDGGCGEPRPQEAGTREGNAVHPVGGHTGESE
ncbi:MAG: nitrate- and nitrite sensing domain-containing protein [Nocardiopsaceae bacterium]|nr:nitrate- and nitrite sensing domain-containing protein [Nocardiopsaceae bacterium]